MAQPAAPVRELPGWLRQALTPPTSAAVTPAAPRRLTQLTRGRATAYLQAIVEGEAAQVAAARSGHSHQTLLRAALRLGNLVGGGALTDADARAALLPAATAHIGTRRCDCTEASVLRTINDGLAYGQRQPRRLQTALTTPRAAARRVPPLIEGA